MREKGLTAISESGAWAEARKSALASDAVLCINRVCARSFIAPSILNNFDVGVSAVSEALTIFPTLVTVGPTDTQIEAIGGLVAPTLVSITPVREVHLRSGLSGTPVDVAVVLAPPNSTAAPAGSADTTAENDSAAGVTPRRGLLK